MNSMSVSALIFSEAVAFFIVIARYVNDVLFVSRKDRFKLSVCMGIAAMFSVHTSA
jgi:hypothetical protein